MVEINPAAAAPEKRPDRSEIEAKPKPAPKVVEASRAAPEPARTEAKPPADLVVTVTDGEVSGSSGAKAEPKLDESAEEKLRHALEVLPKLSLEEIQGARRSLKAELPADQFAVWNSESYSRERDLKARR